MRPPAHSPDLQAGGAPSASFQARVASVGLITTVVVLLAACGAFMLQQWAVTGAQSHRIHQDLASITAEAAGPVIARGQPAQLQAALETLKGSQEVVAARLADPSGKELAAFDRGVPADAATETFQRPVMLGE